MDVMAINLVMNARKTRRDQENDNVTPFTYAIVLTKVDKSNEKTIRALKKGIYDTISMYKDDDDNNDDNNDDNDNDVKIIQSSSVTREGRDSVWTMLGDEIFLV